METKAKKILTIDIILGCLLEFVIKIGSLFVLLFYSRAFNHRLQRRKSLTASKACALMQRTQKRHKNGFSDHPGGEQDCRGSGD